MKGKKRITFFCLIILFILLNTCVASGGKVETEPAGFWSGIWHGLICPITFLISLISDNVGIYETNNNGAWYDFGFLFGIMLFWGKKRPCSSAKKNVFARNCKKKTQEGEDMAENTTAEKE